MPLDLIDAEIVPFSTPDKFEDLSPESQQMLKEIHEAHDGGEDDEDVEADDRTAEDDTEDGDSDATKTVEDPVDGASDEEVPGAVEDERFSKALARIQNSNTQLDDKRKGIDADMVVVKEYQDLIGEDGTVLENDPLSTMRSIFMSATHKDDPAQFEQRLYDQLTSTVLGIPDKNDESLSGQQKLQRQLDVLKRQQKQAEEQRTDEDLKREQKAATQRAVTAFQDALEKDDNTARYPFLMAGADQPGELVWGVVEGEYRDNQTKLSFEEAALLAEEHIKTQATALYKRFGNLLAASTDSDGESAEAAKAKKKSKDKTKKAASLTAKDAGSGPGRKPAPNEWPEDDDASEARVLAELKKLHAMEDEE